MARLQALAMAAACAGAHLRIAACHRGTYHIMLECGTLDLVLDIRIVESTVAVLEHSVVAAHAGLRLSDPAKQMLDTTERLICSSSGP